MSWSARYCLLPPKVSLLSAWKYASIQLGVSTEFPFRIATRPAVGGPGSAASVPPRRRAVAASASPGSHRPRRALGLPIQEQIDPVMTWGLCQHRAAAEDTRAHLSLTLSIYIYRYLYIYMLVFVCWFKCVSVDTHTCRERERGISMSRPNS